MAIINTARGLWLLVLFLGVLSGGDRAAAASLPGCKKMIVEGAVSAGQEWKLDIGEDWVFRVLPISVGNRGYSGWDLVMDRTPPAGFPDALLVATPPFGSLNEREIGTTYGLRAQDAVGWNPRTFRFLTDPEQFRKARADYMILMQSRRQPETGPSGEAQHRSRRKATAGLLDLEKSAAIGELRILEAQLTPGIADPAPYASGWATSHTPYHVQPAPVGKSTPRGTLTSMRFSVALWLPKGWNVPPGLSSFDSVCGR